MLAEPYLQSSKKLRKDPRTMSSKSVLQPGPMEAGTKTKSKGKVLLVIDQAGMPLGNGMYSLEWLALEQGYVAKRFQLRILEFPLTWNG